MNNHINHLIDLLSYAFIGAGLFFWFWGTWPLVGPRSILFKLHSLSVADTLGSMLIIFGLLLKIPREWPLLVLALISLAIWNTVLGYVLAYCSTTAPTTALPDPPLSTPAAPHRGSHG